MLYLCKCKKKSKKYCTTKSCKNCCKDENCKIHNQIFCIACSQKNYSIKCNQFMCSNCCTNKNCSNMEHRNNSNKCICKKNKFSTNCIVKKCYDCCDNINCRSHKEKFNKCIDCNINNYKCNFKKCENCCDDATCAKHFPLCKCNKNFIGLKCKYRKCSECCKNLKCHLHYLQDIDLDTKILNNYKIELYKYKLLPTEIVNKIIDEFLDSRFTCSICTYKINFQNDFFSGKIVQCDICNIWICSDWVNNNCCKILNDVFRSYYYCSKCYDSCDKLEITFLF